MKKCVVISDSFKGTLSSQEICTIARESLAKLFPCCEVETIPVADGGEGTTDCFEAAVGAERVCVPVSGPYGETVEACYVRRGNCAVVETASAAGLPMVGEKQDPESTTTYGVGQLIRHAAQAGCTHILLGLGGSATNDGGAGCAAALGVDFFDEEGTRFVPVGRTLERIKKIDLSGANKQLEHVKITVICDVENPLYGENGAAYVFGPQKGADPEMVRRLDHNLRCLDRVLQKELGICTADIPGAGAAGGMGAGCVAFLNAELKSGIEAILDVVDFDRRLEGADLVITGEGRLDGQSIQGKVVCGVAKRAKARNIPVIAIVGGVDESAQGIYDQGISAVFGIDREAAALKCFAHKSARYYQQTLEDILRLIQIAENFKTAGR